MKRSYKKPRAKRVKLAKPIPPPKPERVKRGDLKKIYKDLITSDVDQRVNTLVKALHWYEKTEVYYGYGKQYRWTKKQLQAKNNAEKHRLDGLNSKVSTTKEEKYTHAIQYYEYLVKGYKPPLIGKYLRLLVRKTKDLQQNKSKMLDKHKKFLAMLYDALQPVNAEGKRIKLTVDKLAAPYRISSEGNITFDRKLISDQRKLAHKHGILSVVINMLPVLSEAGVRVPELDTSNHQTGRIHIDPIKRYQTVLMLLNRFNQYCQREDAPRTIVRRKKAL